MMPYQNLQIVAQKQPDSQALPYITKIIRSAAETADVEIIGNFRSRNNNYNNNGTQYNNGRGQYRGNSRGRGNSSRGHNNNNPSNVRVTNNTSGNSQNPLGTQL